jgi:HK97 gp10 family phage protein
MSIVLTARWTGLDEARRNLEVLGKELADSLVVEPALVKVGGTLRDEIARTAPRSPFAPHVADTFVVKPSKEARELGRTTILVGPKKGRGSVGFIAPFIEFGTSKQPAHPFIRPSYDGWVSSFPGAVVAALQSQYERVIRKYASRARP